MKKIINKEIFLKSASNTLLSILNDIENIDNLDISKMSMHNTSLINVDIINGFCKSGSLSSDRVEAMIPAAVKINSIFQGYKKVFFTDTHKDSSLEFNFFPPHCLIGSNESEIIDELKPFIDENSTVCHKNSTNGFLCPDYSKWLLDNPEITNFIVIGDVTDLCLMQFCLSQRAFMNENNLEGNVLVLVDSVETYDLDAVNHNGDLMNIFALYNMSINGVKLLRF